MTPEQLFARLQRMSDDIKARGAAAAANAMAQEFDRVLVGVTLRKSTHPLGTRTPSAPGSPPALVSGTLRRSVKIVPAAAAGSRASAEVRVGTVYARIQEKGGIVRAKRAPVLGTPKVGFFGKQVKLPARPYMKPTRDVTVASGQLRRAAAGALEPIVLEGGG